MEYQIINPQTGETTTGAIEPVALASKVVRRLLHDAVVMYQANRRVGTVKTKTRAEVKGSSKKLYKQKGTGRARAGNRRTPVRVGGGHAFAKVPKDWSYRLPKKALRLATRMALRLKFESGEVVATTTLSITEPKTRQVATLLKALGLINKKCLFVTETKNDDLVRATRNLQQANVSRFSDLNAEMILTHNVLVMESAVLKLLP